jgi:hypothetical protein
MSANPKLGVNDPISAIAATVPKKMNLLKGFNELVRVSAST